jgi:hypothetical protein
MDSVTVDGILYTKASVVAKRFRYTSDYIGQLCRAKKVNCQLVGRTWYVDESSLTDHKTDRYKSSRVNEITNKINIKIDTGHGVVRQPNAESIKPVLSKRTKRAIGAVVLSPDVTPRPREIKYDTDTYDLIPQAAPKIQPSIPAFSETVENTEQKRLEVSLAAAVPLRVSSSIEPRIDLDFTDVPEVSLQGRVTVTEIPDAIYSDEASVPALSNAEPPKPNFLRNLSAKEPHVSSKNQFTPRAVATNTAPISWSFVCAAVFLGIIVSGVIVTVDSYTLASRATSYSGLTFDLSFFSF